MFKLHHMSLVLAIKTNLVCRPLEIDPCWAMCHQRGKIVFKAVRHRGSSCIRQYNDLVSKYNVTLGHMLTDNSLNPQKLIILISWAFIALSLIYYIPATVSQLVPEYPSLQTQVYSSVVAPSTHVAGYLQGRILHATKTISTSKKTNIDKQMYKT